MNRLAVVAVQKDENQLLCIAKTDNATGRVEAATVKEALDNWESSDGIIASCFDTTSNTGVNIGSTVILQQLLNQPTSCHHIAELILKAAYQTLFGETSAPVATLFSTPSHPGRRVFPGHDAGHYSPQKEVWIQDKERPEKFCLSFFFWIFFVLMQYYIKLYIIFKYAL